MFSDKVAVSVDLADGASSRDHLGSLLERVAQKFELGAALLVRLDGRGGASLELSYRLAEEPLRGAMKPFLAKLVEACTAHHSAPHVHTLTEEFVEQLRGSNPHVTLKYRVIFVPFIIGKSRFAFFGFPTGDNVKAVPPALSGALAGVLRLVALDHEVGVMSRYVTTLERYVKEVGHDISSAVQASISKLNIIAKGLVPQGAIKAKAKEAEEEILGAHRVAENLGLVVDPEYNIGAGADFDLVASVEKAAQHHQSEANERHLEVRVDGVSPIQVWGDQRAIESAIGHYLSNAVKYSIGGGYITVTVTVFEDEDEDVDEAVVEVTNRGIPIAFEDRERIWKFGERGKDALEHHVNGSGIGLFSVRKIVLAHGGAVNVTSEQADPRIVTFSFRLPRGRVMEKSARLLGAKP